MKRRALLLGAITSGLIARLPLPKIPHLWDLDYRTIRIGQLLYLPPWDVGESDRLARVVEIRTDANRTPGTEHLSHFGCQEKCCGYGIMIGTVDLHGRRSISGTMS